MPFWKRLIKKQEGTDASKATNQYLYNTNSQQWQWTSHVTFQTEQVWTPIKIEATVARSGRGQTFVTAFSPVLFLFQILRKKSCIWITRSYWGLFWDETHPALPFSSFCVTPLTNQPTDRAHRCSWTHNPLSRSNQLTFKQSPVLLIFPLGVTLTIHFKCNPYKICHPTLDFYQSDNVSVHRSCSFNVTMVNTPSTLARRNWLKSERAVI